MPHTALAVVVAAVTLGSHGIGTVRFGESERAAVAGLTALFGPPTKRAPNTACGSRYREVVWGGLSVEFRAGRFEGFRYRLSGSALPRLRTATGITLGDTLGRLRSVSGPLSLIGTDRWESADGLVFYDDAKHDPVPPSSRIVEIKFGTCGDF